MKFEQLSKQERKFLERISNTNLDFIYIGDRVKVKQDDGHGREGVVFKIGEGWWSKVDSSHLIYYMQGKDGRVFDNYLKELERLSQTNENAELEQDFSNMRRDRKGY